MKNYHKVGILYQLNSNSEYPRNLHILQNHQVILLYNFLLLLYIYRYLFSTVILHL